MTLSKSRSYTEGSIPYPDTIRPDFRWMVNALTSGDYNLAERIVCWLDHHGSDELFAQLVEKTFVDDNGLLWVGPEFVTHPKQQQVVDFAFWQILAIAPEQVLVDQGIDRYSILRICFRHYYDAHDKPDTCDTSMQRPSGGYTRMTHFPRRIYRFPNLIEIDARSTSLSSFPKSICKCKNLRSLRIHDGGIRVLPEEIGMLRDLEVLDLNECALLKLPDALMQLTKLRHVSLVRNRLSEFPVQLFSLPDIRQINLAANRISFFEDSIPADCPLEELDLSNNRFEHLPATLGNLTNLTRLGLESNEHLRRLPVELVKLKNLKELVLHGCYSISPSRVRGCFESSEQVAKVLQIIEWTGGNSNVKGDVEYDCDFETLADADGSDPVLDSLLASTDMAQFAAGLRLLESIADPELTERFMRKIKWVTMEDCNLLLGIEEEASPQAAMLIDFLSRPGFPVLRGFGTWLDSMRSLVLPVLRPDLPEKVHCLPRLRDLVLVYNTPISLVEVPDNVALNELNICNLESISLHMVSPNCRIGEIFLCDCVVEQCISIVNQPRLKHVALQRTEFGRLEIRDCPNLLEVCIRVLDFDFDTPEETVPVSLFIRNCPKLTKIVVHGGQLTEANIAEVPVLQELRITGPIEDPEQLQIEAHGLTTVQLSQSGLSEVPSFLTHLRKLQFLDLRNNGIGEWPNTMAGFTAIEVVLLSGNRFVQIPDPILHLPALHTLAMGFADGVPKRKIRQEINRLRFKPSLKEFNFETTELQIRQLAYLFKGRKFKLARISRGTYAD